MLLTRSGSTLVLFCWSGSRCWPAPGWPRGLTFSGGDCFGARRPRQRRPAVDVLLADQRLRADLAGRVLAEVLEAGIVDLQHQDRLARGLRCSGRFRSCLFARHRHADRLDRSDAGAGDAHFLACDQERAVVEDRPHAGSRFPTCCPRRRTIRATIAATTPMPIRVFFRLFFMVPEARRSDCIRSVLTPAPGERRFDERVRAVGRGLGRRARAGPADRRRRSRARRTVRSA